MQLVGEVGENVRTVGSGTEKMKKFNHPTMNRKVIHSGVSSWFGFSQILKCSRSISLQPKNVKTCLLSYTSCRRYSLNVPDQLAPTVYALSTHPGKAAIAVVRVTGPSCKYVCFQGLN